MTDHGKVLPANIDDPRFQDRSVADRSKEWTATDAMKAELTDPLDEVGAIMRSRFGFAALVEGFVAAALEMIDSLISGLSHLSPH